MKIKTFTKILSCLMLCCFVLTTISAQIPQDGLVGHYPLDGNGDDYSSSNNQGTIVGAVTSTTGFDGTDGGALLLEGGHVNLGNPVEYALLETLTVSLWIKPTGLSDWQAVVTKWNDFGNGGFYMGINPDFEAIRWNADMPSPQDGGTLTENSWVHVAVTLDGEFSRIYIDGELVTSNAYTQFMDMNPAQVMIGTQYAAPLIYTFIGAVDELLIYNRGITAEEVSAIYNYIPTSTEKIYDPKLDITVYPNPADDFLYLKSEAPQDDMTFEILDVQGKRVLNGSYDDRRIDIETLSPGLYFLSLNIEDQFVVRKFVVK